MCSNLTVLSIISSFSGDGTAPVNTTIFLQHEVKIHLKNGSNLFSFRPGDTKLLSLHICKALSTLQLNIFQEIFYFMPLEE